MKTSFIIRAGVTALLSAGCIATMTAAEQDYIVFPLAGASSVGSADGPGTDARFWAPSCLLLDSAGNLLIGDARNYTIRKLSPSGQVSTYSGMVGKSEMINGPIATARFNGPTGLARDIAGNLYVADTLMVRKITPDGIVSTLAGWPWVPDTKPLLFHDTGGIAVDSSGNVTLSAFIGYQNYGVARITPDGTVTTLSLVANEWTTGVALDPNGTVYYSFTNDAFHEGVSSLSPNNDSIHFAGGGKSGSVDGVGTAASFYDPSGIKFAANGNLYVADRGNNAIRIITPAGVVSTLAGAPPATTSTNVFPEGALLDGTGNGSRFWSPSDIAIDSANNVFVADTGNNAIRKITPTGQTSTVAGLYPASAENINGTGAAARFHDPRGIAVGPAGELYVADAGNRAIRKVSPAGAVTTLASTAGIPEWTAADTTGNVYVSEDTGVIEKISPDGTISTLAGPFPSAAGLAVDLSGNVYVADSKASSIHKIAPGGSVSELNLTTSPGSSVLLRGPQGLALDGAGNLYVVNEGRPSKGTEYPSPNFAYISKIDTTGATSVIAGLPDGWLLGDDEKNIQRDLTIATPRGITVGPEGNIYVTGGGPNFDTMQSIFHLSPTGPLTRLALHRADGKPDSLFGYITGVAVDRLGVLYVTDNGTNFNVVHKIVPAGTLPTITTQPQSQTASAGNSVQFSVGASGNPAPTFQWYFNQVAISGATGSSYSVANIQSKDAGDYSVIVSNAWGQVISAKATLSLSTATNPPPTTTPGSGSSSAGGGGRIETWFAILILGLCIARRCFTNPIIGETR
jgi:sugar lactone lactonase YvrE